MSEEETPGDAIDRLRAELAPLSDEMLLDRLRSLAPMPDGGLFDPAWDAQATWDQMYILAAFGAEIGARRLVSGIELLYERLPLDDPGEMTRSFRHGPERATEGNDALLVQFARQRARRDSGRVRSISPIFGS